MSRFEELKRKISELGGFYSLPPEEREEYQKLKAEVEVEEEKKKEEELDKEVEEVQETEAVQPESEPEDKSEARIKALEKAMASLMNENLSLKEEATKLQEGWQEYTPPTDKNKTATLKVYRKDSDSPEGVIVGARVFKQNAWNEETHKYNKLIYKINVKFEDDKEEEYEIGAEELASIRNVEKVEIIKEEKRTLRKVDEYVRVPGKTPDGYSLRSANGGGQYGTSMGDIEVPVEVFTVQSTVVVKRKNGQQITLDANNLNL